MNDTLNFFKDRVRYNNPEHMVEGYDEFKELYNLITPVKGYIDELIIHNPSKYQVKIKVNESPMNIKDWILDTAMGINVSPGYKNEVIYSFIDERTIDISLQPKE
jgi:hypothetical protein